MIQEDHLIAASDGFELTATLFDGGSISKTNVVIIASDIGVRRGRYEDFAIFLCKQGFQVVTFDYRGIGDSLPTGIRQSPADLTDWGKHDLSGVISWTASEYGNAAITVLGHGVGGQILPLATNRRLVDAVILVASYSGYWKFLPSQTKYAMLLLWTFVLPILTVLLGYLPGRLVGLNENLPAWVAREWAYWSRHPDYLGRDGVELIRAQFASLKVPLLAYSFWDDPMAPQEAVDELMEWYASAQITRRHIEEADLEEADIGHFGFFTEKHRRSMWEAGALSWLKQLPKRQPGTVYVTTQISSFEAQKKTN